MQTIVQTTAPTVVQRRFSNSLIGVFLLATLLLPGCIVIPVADLLKPPPLVETVIEKGEGFFYRPKVALIDISGTITGQPVDTLAFQRKNTLHEVQERLDRIEADREVVALVLKISSPGGEVTACDVIRQSVLDLKERKNLPVVACIVETGASGGYYIASAADTIIAHPTAVVGSIGVILQTFNIKGLFDKIGVKTETVKSGTFKDLASPFRDATDAERKVLSDIVQELHGRFVDVVDEGRPNLDRDRVLELADGKVYSGKRAEGLGLVDANGYVDDAVAEARRRSGVSGTALIRYSRAGRPGNSLYAVGGPDTPTRAAGGISLRVDAATLPTTRFLYLWVP